MLKNIRETVFLNIILLPGIPPFSHRRTAAWCVACPEPPSGRADLVDTGRSWKRKMELFCIHFWEILYLFNSLVLCVRQGGKDRGVVRSLENNKKTTSHVIKIQI